MTRKPHIYKRGGGWYVNCKHGQRVGPYYTFFWASQGAALLWEAYGR